MTFLKVAACHLAITLTNTDDNANYHTSEEYRLHPTDNSTSSPYTIVIEDDKLHALTSRQFQIDI